MQRFSKKVGCLQKSPSRSIARQSGHIRNRFKRSERYELQRQEEHLKKIRLQLIFHHTRQSHNLRSKICKLFHYSISIIALSVD